MVTPTTKAHTPAMAMIMTTTSAIRLHHPTRPSIPTPCLESVLSTDSPLNVRHGYVDIAMVSMKVR
jgi:hypothetical protein